MSNPTKTDKKYWAVVASIGCIACLLDGLFNDQVSIHHCDGRTKPGAHKKVLGLCAGHHQDGTGAPGLIAVHPYKARFEAKYGTQSFLMELTNKIIEERGLLAA